MIAVRFSNALADVFNRIQVDIKMVFRLMFGGGQFDDVFGDVCELPMLKQVHKPLYVCMYVCMYVYEYCLRMYVV